MAFSFLHDLFGLSQYFPYGDYPLSPDFHAYRGDCHTPGHCIDFDCFEGVASAYENCIPLKSIINQLAFSLANANIWVIDSDGKDVEKYEYIKELFLHPNPLQSGREFLFEMDVLLKVYGEVFIYKNSSPLTGQPYTLWNINPMFIKEKITGKWVNQTDINQINEYWTYRNPYTSTEIRFDNSDLMQIKDVNLNLGHRHHFRGESRIKGLEKDVLNILTANDAILSLNTDRGAMGMLSPDGKDAAGAITYNSIDKAEIYREYNRMHGITHGRSKLFVTNKPTKYTQMSLSAKDLMIYEGYERNIQNIAMAYFYPHQILLNTTYNNQDTSQKSLYQNGVIPMSLIYGQKFTNFLGIEGARIDFDFSHIEFLQQSEKEKNDAVKTKVDMTLSLYNQKLASKEEVRMAAGLSEDFKYTEDE